MSIIAITGSLFAAKCGDSNTNRYTIITTERRNFQMLDGTATIVESSQSESLKIWLQSDFGENLAAKVGVDAQRISRMRQALGVGYADGGNRRAMSHDEAPDLTGRLKIVGGDAKQIIVLSAYIDTWQLVAGTQILIQPTAKPHLKRWLQQVSVDDAAAKLAVGKRQITEIKRLLNILRK